jgi:hypothetical protein
MKNCLIAFFALCFSQIGLGQSSSDTTFVIIQNSRALKKMDYLGCYKYDNVVIWPKRSRKTLSSPARYGKQQLTQGFFDRPCKFYDTNGKLLAVGYFDSEAFDKAYQEFHRNGNVKVSGTYAEGVLVGTWKYFDKKGNLKETIEYDSNGNVVDAAVGD